MPSKLKRLPNNSFTIIIKFGNIEDRDDYMNSEEFKKVYGNLLSKILIRYQCKIGTLIN